MTQGCIFSTGGRGPAECLGPCFIIRAVCSVQNCWGTLCFRDCSVINLAFGSSLMPADTFFHCLFSCKILQGCGEWQGIAILTLVAFLSRDPSRTICCLRFAKADIIGLLDSSGTKSRDFCFLSFIWLVLFILIPFPKHYYVSEPYSDIAIYNMFFAETFKSEHSESQFRSF